MLGGAPPSVFLWFSYSMALSRWQYPSAGRFIIAACPWVSVNMAFLNRVFYNRFCTSSKPRSLITHSPCVSVTSGPALHPLPSSPPSVFLWFSYTMALSRWPCPSAAGFIMTAPWWVSVSLAFLNRVFYNRFCTSSKPIVIIDRCPCVSVSMAF